MTLTGLLERRTHTNEKKSLRHSSVCFCVLVCVRCTLRLFLSLSVELLAAYATFIIACSPPLPVKVTIFYFLFIRPFTIHVM